MDTNHPYAEVSLIIKTCIQNNLINSNCLSKRMAFFPTIVMQQNSAEQTDIVHQDTLVYADIGPSSVKKRLKHAVTLRPDDTDDRVEYALLNHSLQNLKPAITSNQDSIAGKAKLISLYANVLLI